MRTSKKIKYFFLRRIAWVLFFCLLKTLRYKYIDKEKYKAGFVGGAAFCQWHEHIFASISSMYYEKNKIHGLASRNGDGSISAYVIKKLGHNVVWGSSTRGGKEASTEMKKILTEKGSVALTIDGPRGPRHRVAAGIINLAKETGKPIIPFCAIPKKYWCLEKTWDKTIIPKPFSKVLILSGDPIYLKKDISSEEFEAAKKTVAAGLMKIEEEIRSKLEDV